ncbi:MAG: response regulator [Deltaproteobacteria bacterium]|jgi:two-component system NtrC family sensor kinase|nr:response regulator [Deltaproteobacteria bacterium]
MNKILLLDDEKPILGVLKRVFFDKPWGTYTASDPEEALQMVKENNFAVIISDFKMPKMNGLEFLTKARAISPDSVMMVFSGYAESEAISKAIDDGILSRFIPKPWNNTELYGIIKQGLERYELAKKNKELFKTVQRQTREIVRLKLKIDKP